MSQEALTDCLTIQPLLPSLSPLDMINSKLGQSPIPSLDLYTDLLTSGQSSHCVSLSIPFPRAVPQGQPSSNSSHLALLRPQQDSYRFVDRSTHQLNPGSHQHQLPGPSSPHTHHPTVLSLKTSTPLNHPSHTPVVNTDQHPGFSGQIQMVYSPLYNNGTHKYTKQTNSCHLMEIPEFDDSLSQTFPTQNRLDISQRALSGLTVYDLQGASQDLLVNPVPVMSEDAYLHVSAVDRCPSQLSCIYTEEHCYCRFKPMQKVDGVSGENFSGGGQHTPSAAEQTVIAQSQHHQQYLDTSRALPDFVELDLGETNVDNVGPDDIKALQSLYREHCEAILDVVVNLQFSLIEKLWQTFWRYSPSDSVEGATITENRSSLCLSLSVSLLSLLSLSLSPFLTHTLSHSLTLPLSCCH
ncbi:unnamed protein product [Oncorhynchus mykiss]|uniref:RFX1-4/6/8-like BCD domain-containing protein n=1 Tax=Oncorhynchus mykiss TaxID=8022 RepID=A0A060XPP8_ONCMY|nr:unnamed protein product [Oncorhynchus mykiss]